MFKGSKYFSYLQLLLNLVDTQAPRWHAGLTLDCGCSDIPGQDSNKNRQGQQSPVPSRDHGGRVICSVNSRYIEGKCSCDVSGVPMVSRSARRNVASLVWGLSISPTSAVPKFWQSRPAGAIFLGANHTTLPHHITPHSLSIKMGRELQKKKNKSSIPKKRQKGPSKKKILQNPIIAKHWYMDPYCTDIFTINLHTLQESKGDSIAKLSSSWSHLAPQSRRWWY